MKIQLDTDNKIIKLDEKVNLGDFMDLLNTLLPFSKWREFTLETNTVINWDYPIVTQPTIINPYTPRPWWEQPWITYGTTTKTEYSLNSGTYNIEI